MLLDIKRRNSKVNFSFQQKDGTKNCLFIKWRAASKIGVSVFFDACTSHYFWKALHTARTGTHHKVRSNWKWFCSKFDNFQVEMNFLMKAAFSVGIIPRNQSSRISTGSSANQGEDLKISKRVASCTAASFDILRCMLVCSENYVVHVHSHHDNSYTTCMKV